MIIDSYPSYPFKIFVIHLKILIRGSHLFHATWTKMMQNVIPKGYILDDLPVLEHTCVSQSGVMKVFHLSLHKGRGVGVLLLQGLSGLLL